MCVFLINCGHARKELADIFKKHAPSALLSECHSEKPVEWWEDVIRKANITLPIASDEDSPRFTLRKRSLNLKLWPCSGTLTKKCMCTNYFLSPAKTQDASHISDKRRKSLQAPYTSSAAWASTIFLGESKEVISTTIRSFNTNLFFRCCTSQPPSSSLMHVTDTFLYRPLISSIYTLPFSKLPPLHLWALYSHSLTYVNVIYHKCISVLYRILFT